MMRTADGKGLLFADWGTYFNCIKNPTVQLPQIKKCCHILYVVMQGKDDMGIYHSTITLNDGTKRNGFALSVVIKKDAPLLNCLNVEVSEAAFALFDMCIKNYIVQKIVQKFLSQESNYRLALYKAMCAESMTM